MIRSTSFLAALAAAPFLSAQQLPDAWAQATHWRSIGPTTMGGRIIALAVYEAEPSTWWAATASGGLVKTTNNGVTFEHQFDHEAVVSIGHVAVSQSNKDIVWVGTGEANPRNSVSYGNGVYKSTDGGKTWAHMGLDKTFQTGRIAIHPTNPDIVYVGALGRLYGPNEERGLYKTTDGGKTWNKVLYVDDQTGVVDIDMHPTDPDTLMVATYERARDGFDTNDPAKRWGPGGGIWKTTDGGVNWMRIKTGLPSCQIGRVGIDYYRKDPNVLMAIVESEMIAKQPDDAAYHGAQLATADAGVKIATVERSRGGARGNRRGGGRGGDQTEDAEQQKKPEPTPAAKAGLKKDDVILAVGGKRVNSEQQFERECRQYRAGDEVVLSIVRDRKDLEVTIKFGKYPKGARSPFVGTLGGQSGGSPDLQGENGHEYGGIYKSTDGGDSWTRINTLNPRPMYYSQIRIDPSNSDNIMVLGTSLYRSTDGGKTFDRGAGSGMHVDHHAEWIDPNNGDHIIHGCDGGIYVTWDAGKNWDHLNHVAIGQFYHVGVSSDRNYRVYGGLQDNGSWRGPSTVWENGGIRNLHWQEVCFGDGFATIPDPKDSRQGYAMSQGGSLVRWDLRDGSRKSIRPPEPENVELRFHWNAAIALDPFASDTVYYGSQFVHMSPDRGDSWQVISPDLTSDNPEWQKQEQSGGLTIDVTAAENHCTILTIAPSPVQQGVIWVGTDDGRVHVTRDGGESWTSVEANVPNRPANTWCPHIEASKFDAATAFAVFDGHRNADWTTYVYVTRDHGATWTSLATDDIDGYCHCIEQDPVQKDLLWVGTEFGLFVTFDGGAHWQPWRHGVPTCAARAI
ncbi:MAG: PDZ domain-containing protein, partial [Planctomycetes bacterium]|nr:PDZ domain-containing protein [Planctomycetota bacterium]